MATFPHCDYNTQSIFDPSGSNIQIQGIQYVDRTGSSQSIGIGPDGVVSESIDFLNSNLQSYGLFINNGGQVSVRLSENDIESIDISVDGNTQTMVFDQVGGSCIDLPAYSELSTSVNSIKPENIQEWAVIELSILGAIMSIVTMAILIKKI